MKLSQLTERLENRVVSGAGDPEITDLVFDSRKICEGCIFVCIAGANFDGHDAASEAAQKGAAAIVVEKEVDITQAASDGSSTGPVVLMTDSTRRALAVLSAAWFGHPAETLKVIGVTGTKGKTTTTYMVKSILENAGMKVGLIGTIEAIIGDEVIPAANTTPESYVIQDYFSRMLKKGIEVVVMEVSSQGLMMHRTDGFEFELGIFTNIEPDHIGPGEHSSFEEYMECKGLLFKQCRHGIANIDDRHTPDVTAGHTCDLVTYGFSEGADYRASDVNYVKGPGYLGVEYDVTGKTAFHVEVDLPGEFTVYNSLTAIAVCDHFGVGEEAMKKALKVAHAKGRIEPVKISDDFTLMIDYAHNAMSLKSLLESLRKYDPGRLVVLFGCGGNRSKLRRYEMGEVAGNMADFTIITSDNPRFEEPMDIIADIEVGMAKTDGEFVEVPDRKEAIRYAIENARKGDVIVLAGKGHEDYQEIKGVKHHMDERELIAEVVDELS
ncbi:MAG: UDP-N-acetylmuramoyl-L-alanyl-D-glutamate--2,6-diaminopimelate ligase [Eubacterium sp.]|nr:UDP-N-acetylmuramoyl-L-alanyl-D-glutamate--2,6-diaminopimelate ligase [Eubacterium sp.]